MPAATQPATAQPSSLLAISDWTSINKNTLVGSFTVTLPDGMMIVGCMAHRRQSGMWIALPGAPQVENGQVRRSGDGKALYKAVIRFHSADGYKRFQALVLEELAKLGLI